MPDFRITIDVKDVSGGDIDALADSILDDHGVEFEAEQGNFTVRVSQKLEDNFYNRDAGDDVLE